MHSRLTLQGPGNRNSQAFFERGSPQPNVPFRGRSACGSSFSPGRGQPSLPQGRAQLRSAQPAKSGPHRAAPARPQQPLDPRQRGWAWAPAATAPPTRAREQRVRPTRYAGPGPTCRGERGSWTAATGPRAGAPAAGARPRDPGYPRRGRAGRDAGGLPRASAARRGGRGDLALPSAPVRRRRRHFAFHSVSPPPHSAAGFPDVGISRRRLRGGRGLGASVRRAARRRQPARRLQPPAAAALRGRPVPCVWASVAPRRPASPPPGAAPVTRRGRAIRLSPSESTHFSLAFTWALSVHG
ncbi:uncharacterized protein [Vulpes vulpes]|uniref:Uncharacterized protein n=1 Tax=Vulpes vulpes TaxID=9627 RepID=A0ABM4ZNU2_VULVU